MNYSFEKVVRLLIFPLQYWDNVVLLIKMLKRKVLNDLKKWKDNHKKECLMVLGARQIGKTYIIREFVKDNYDNVLEINFLERPECKEIFDGNLDSVSILKEISLSFSQFKLEDNKTLIFLDEIQDCQMQ